MSGFFSKVKKFLSEVEDSPWTSSSGKTPSALYEELKANAFKNFEEFECSDPLLKKLYDSELERCKEASTDLSLLTYALKEIAILRSLIECGDFYKLFDVYMDLGDPDEFGKTDPLFAFKKLERYAHLHGSLLYSQVGHLLHFPGSDKLELRRILPNIFYEGVVTDEDRKELEEHECYNIASRLDGIFSSYELLLEDEDVQLFQEYDFSQFLNDFKSRYLSESVTGRLIENKYFGEVIDDDAEMAIRSLDKIATDDEKFHYLVLAVQSIEYIRALEMCEYLEPLLLKYSELSYFDDYGDLDDSEFDDEFILFLEKKHEKVLTYYVENIKSVSANVDYKVFEDEFDLSDTSGFLYHSIKSAIKMAYLSSITDD